MPDSGQSIGELFAFFHDAILVALLTGAILGPAGLFLHLRRSLFLGAALPQIAGFGFVLASLLGIPNGVSAGATILLFAVAAVWKPLGRGRGMVLESGIAFGYTVAMAGTVLLLAMTSAEGHAAELLLKGSVLASTCRDTQLLALCGVPLVLVLFLLRRRLYLVSLDPETAKTLGIRVVAYEVLLFTVLGAAITLTLGEAGALACFGFLLFPGLAALAICRQVGSMFLFSATIGVLGAGGGVTLALWRDLPAGPAMVMALVLLWVLARIIGAMRKEEAG